MSLRSILSAVMLAIYAANGDLARAEEASADPTSADPTSADPTSADPASADPANAAANPAAAAKEPATLREPIDQSFPSYELFASADSEQPAEPLVALRWANNARGSEDGTTVLYVAGGRPLAVCCVYPWAGRLEHGFESLSRDKIVARRDGQIVWQPQQPSVKFAAVPEAPAPHESRTQRLRQMKQLAEQFQATMLGWKADSTDREQLRLLSKPLYRYEPPDGAEFDGAVLDGAVFAFVTGTDPEVLLLIEAVKEGERTSWQFAFVRRTSGQLEGRWQDKLVWEAARFPPQNDPRRSYYTIGTPLPPAIRELETRRDTAAQEQP